MTILLLEDDAGVSELMRQSLQACGYETISAQSAGEALAWLEAHSPDLMLVDYSLPDMDGKEFIEALAQKRSPLPAFIVATGRSDVRIAVEMMKLGARDYIVKDLNFLAILPELIKKVFKELDNEKRLEHAEQALRENEEKFRALYDNAPLSYQSLDTNGRFLDVNPTWLRTLGYERSEVIGSRFADFLHPDWKAHFEKNFPAFKRRGYVHDVQFKIRHKDGHYLDISFEGCVGYLPDGSFRQTYCVFQDITERKRAEDALKESEEKYRLVFQNSKDGIALLTIPSEELPGSFLDVNEEYCKMLGYSPKEFLTLSPWKVFAPEKQEKILELKAILFAQKHLLYESVLQSKAGRKIPVEVNSHLFDYHGQMAAISIVRDITERKLTEEELKAALNEKEILLRELYHRTKNNMQVISAMLALQSSYINNEEALHILKDMEHRIQSMALVHQKLYQSQNLSRINLGQYIDDLAALLLKSYATSQQIGVEIDAEEVFVLIDTAIPCGLIINELLTNALKHAFPEGQDGLIRVTIHRVETTDVDLSVSDNGVGFPEDFDLRNTKTLGLQTVFALAERQLHGAIQFTVEDGLLCHIRFRDNLYKERV